jgi:hypothetical protein
MSEADPPRPQELLCGRVYNTVAKINSANFRFVLVGACDKELRPLGG